MRQFKHEEIVIQFEEDFLLKYIKKHLHNSNNETGGMLCGYYSDDFRRATITSFCEPASDSILQSCGFTRGISGAKELLESEWRQGNYYLGDWHLHPFSNPVASKQDLTQLKVNAKDKSLKCPEPIMIIVGGVQNLDFNVYVFMEEKIFLCEAI